MVWTALPSNIRPSGDERVEDKTQNYTLSCSTWVSLGLGLGPKKGWGKLQNG
jgi:hypothetical protein